MDKSAANAKKYFIDAVEIYADGKNIKDLSGVKIDLVGNNVAANDETYMNGFEGTGNAVKTDDSANIDIHFGSTEKVSELEIKYFSSNRAIDDAIFDPKNQYIGISDFSFQNP